MYNPCIMQCQGQYPSDEKKERSPDGALETPPIRPPVSAAIRQNGGPLRSHYKKVFFPFSAREDPKKKSFA